MAQQRGWVWACGLLLAASTAEAQVRERVVVVAASVDGAASSREVLPALDRLRVQLAADGRAERWPDIITKPSAVAVADARALGRTAFSALANGRPDAVAEVYETKIQEALQGVAALRDAEARSVLSNLCALRVNMRVLSDHADVRGEGAKLAAADCLRRFRERPPLGKIWPEEVLRAFDAADQEAPTAAVSIKSAPAGCEVFIYGAGVGRTPVVLDLAHGLQEVQVECEGRASALHRIAVYGPREIVIRAATDAALVEWPGGLGFRYASPELLARQLAEDAATLAAEAGADAFVAVHASGGDAELTWRPLAGPGGGHARVVAAASPEARARAIAALFHPAPPSASAPAASARSGLYPALDYVLGGALIAGGVGLSVPAFLALARDGECANDACTAVYDGQSGAGTAMFVGAGVLVAGGVGWLIWRPLGRRAAVSVGVASVRVGGTF